MINDKIFPECVSHLQGVAGDVMGQLDDSPELRSMASQTRMRQSVRPGRLEEFKEFIGFVECIGLGRNHETSTH